MSTTIPVASHGPVLLLAFGLACSGSGTDGATGSAGAGGNAGAASISGAAQGGNAAAGTNSESGGAVALAGLSGGGASGAAVGGGAAGAGNEGGGGPADARPNILVVLFDDMGYSDLGSYGGEARTPNIDQLAERGTRFRNFYVTPRCSPTRISLMTGLYTQQAATSPGDPLPPLRTDNNVTLPEMLAASGYHTYMAGKWHLGESELQWPSRRGFDYVFGMGPNAAGKPPPNDKWDASEYNLVGKDSAIAERSYGEGEFYQSTAIGDYALDYLTHHGRQADGEPFFMYLAFNAPHFPVQAPAALADGYMADYGKGWEQARTLRYQRMLERGVIDATFGLSEPEPFDSGSEIPLWSSLTAAQRADSTRKMALYSASIESVDSAIGRVVERLEQSGELENTLILVLSDNGGNAEGGIMGRAFGKAAPLTGTQLEQMGQPGQADGIQVGGGWAHVQNTPFRLYKHFTHGGGVRSPLVVSWPARIASSGSWSSQLGHVIDLVPTILDAAHASQPASFAGHPVLPLEGMTLLPAIQNGTAQPRQLGFEHETNRAWIDGRFKLVVHHENADELELYDLETDPSEMHDLSETKPARLTSMVQAWNAWAKRVGVPNARLLPVP